MNLSAFKKILESAKNHSQMIKSTVINKNGEIVKLNDFAPVCHTQSNSFALLRNNTFSWLEYGKASEWEFENSNAIKNFKDGGKIVLEFKDPSFFGF